MNFYYVHFLLLTSGLCGTSVLLAVFIQEYTDASQRELGTLLASFPFVGMLIKPIFCSMADRHQTHKLYLILTLVTMLIGYSPFIIIPYCTQFYTEHPRWSWCALVIACHIGNGGLEVAWSLADSLAANYAQKTGASYGRMRLVGTWSWGGFGLIIGQINELPYFPKYVPAFFILHVSVMLEILLLLLWNKEDFIMCDPEEKTTKEVNGTDLKDKLSRRDSVIYGSMPGCSGRRSSSIHRGSSSSSRSLSAVISQEKGIISDSSEKKAHDKNPQVFLLKMIITQDGRLIKYLVLFAIFGFLMAPLNFVFLSLVEVCKERGYNFSQLGGAIIMSQAGIEGVSFISLPYIMSRVSRRSILTFAWTILAVRYFYYSFYTSNISPYWALIAEWGLGISYATFCTYLADLSLMFASESKLFIGELRKMGYLSELNSHVDPKKIEEEENAIRTSLKATFFSLFGGCLDGFGFGMGALISGLIVTHSYITLWQTLAIISVCTALGHQIIEITRCKFSDRFKAREGTKAYEIMMMSANHLAKAKS